LGVRQINLVSQATLSHGVTTSISSSGEGRTLLCQLPNECVSLSCHKGFSLSSLVGRQLFHWCANMGWIAKGTRSPFYQCCVTFIDRECWSWHYRLCKLLLFQDKLLLQGKVFLGLEFCQVYLPFLLICFMQLLKGSLLSGCHSFEWPTSFGLFVCLDYGLCFNFFFSPFLGCFLFYKVW